MEYIVREMEKNDWGKVSSIYEQGIKSGATFQNKVPTFEFWDSVYLNKCRLVICHRDEVIGWVAVRHISPREAYNGVVELSIYIDGAYKGKGIGSRLLKSLIEKSEEEEIWSIQVVILSSNIGSIKLHEKCGFRKIGIREKVARHSTGEWMDVILMERRSKKIY